MHVIRFVTDDERTGLQQQVRLLHARGCCGPTGEGHAAQAAELLVMLVDNDRATKDDMVNLFYNNSYCAWCARGANAAGPAEPLMHAAPG